MREIEANVGKTTATIVMNDVGLNVAFIVDCRFPCSHNCIVVIRTVIGCIVKKACNLLLYISMMFYTRQLMIHAR
jgi:hypothetical protein